MGDGGLGDLARKPGKEEFMRIAYVYPESLPSQKARAVQVVCTCHALALRVERLHLFTALPPKRSGGRENPGEEIFRHYGLTCPENLVVTPLRRKWGPFTSTALFEVRLRRCLREFGCEVAISRHLQSCLGMPSGMPVVFEAHQFLREKPGVSRKIARMEERAFRSADAVAYLSAHLRDRARAAFSLDCPDAVIPSGTTVYDIDKETGRPTRDFLYVGSTRYAWKGIDVLLQALEFLPEAVLHLVGPLEGSWSEGHPEIRKRVGQGRLKIYGYLPPERIRGMLREFEIAVLPNTSEDANSRLYTSPLKLLEYMAAQIAVVASDLPSVRELVSEEEVLFAKPDDPEALATGVRTLLGDPELRSRLARNARERAKSYSWENRARKFEELARRAREKQIRTSVHHTTCERS
jgi:glycosyltransferase involved in cell wall biosynthesis